MSGFSLGHSVQGHSSLAEKEPCVIGAVWIISCGTGGLSQRIHSRLYGARVTVSCACTAPARRARKTPGEKDKRRRVYYKHYTDGDWGMSQNYHLSLDSGIIGIQRCVDIISELAKTL